MLEAAHHLRHPEGMGEGSQGIFRLGTGRVPLADGDGKISYKGPLYTRKHPFTAIDEPGVLKLLFHPSEPPDAKPTVVAVVYSTDGGATADFAELSDEIAVFDFTDLDVPVMDISLLRPRYRADNPIHRAYFHADADELNELIHYVRVNERPEHYSVT